jgi:hypothetical protein
VEGGSEPRRRNNQARVLVREAGAFLRTWRAMWLVVLLDEADEVVVVTVVAVVVVVVVVAVRSLTRDLVVCIASVMFDLTFNLTNLLLLSCSISPSISPTS